MFYGFFVAGEDDDSIFFWFFLGIWFVLCDGDCRGWKEGRREEGRREEGRVGRDSIALSVSE